MKRALVLSLICVVGFAFSGLAATLSGSWDTDVTIDPQETNFNDAIGLVSVLTVAYTVGDWTFTSVTDLDESGWTDQDFSVAGVLGAFSLSSALDFDPLTPAFGSWNTAAAVAIAGVSFGADFTLAGNDVTLVLDGSGVAGDVTVDVEITFGGDDNDICDLDWAGIVIGIDFPFCCADIGLAVEFNCSGFEKACFSTTGIAVPNMPYLSLDVEICFTMEEKVVTITPGFDFGDIACFTIDFATDWDTANLSLTSIAIGGLGLTCDIGGVTFTGYTAFVDEYMDGEYWEWYTIETSDDGCCGPFDFDLTFKFLQGGIRLFDIALIDANVSLELAAQFAFNMGLEINVEAGGFTEWTVGFLVTW